MSIHDVSKHDDQRLDPKANASDTRAQRDAHGTNSVNYVSDATAAPVSGVSAGGGDGVKAGLKQLVAICPLNVVNDGSSLTTATISHRLGYAPKVEADIENATLTTASGSVSGANVAVPIFTAASIAGGNVTFQTFVYAFADASNVYVNLLNGTGSPTTIKVTCYLYRASGL
jgi:hypothetical protein